MSNTDKSGDSNELEALFDSIASGVRATAPSPVPPAAQPSPPPQAAPKKSLIQQACESDGTSEDSNELQELFDSIADRQRPSNDVSATDVVAGVQGHSDGSAGGESGWPAQGKVFNQVGQMARQLHDTLGALGYDKLIEKTISQLPDAQDRLAYIANLTEQAACKVLNATDIANPIVEELESGAGLLCSKWDALYANKLSIDEFKLLASETRAFLKNGLPQRTAATKDQLMEIMMAQDFQDLTGQVIKKVVSLAQNLESQLMSLLVETMPGDKRTESVQTLLNGPVVNAEGRADVVVSQQQVDELLDSLGF